MENSQIDVTYNEFKDFILTNNTKDVKRLNKGFITALQCIKNCNEFLLLDAINIEDDLTDDEIDKLNVLISEIYE